MINRRKNGSLYNEEMTITPLGAIIGYSGMLINGYFGEMKAEQVDALADIQDRRD